MSNLVPRLSTTTARGPHIDSITRRVQFTLASIVVFLVSLVAVFLPGLPVIGDVSEIAVVASGLASAGGAGATAHGVRRAITRYRRNR